MIWMMIVYFFAVIGLVALLHFCIGLIFTHAEIQESSEAHERLKIKALKLKRFNDEVEANIGQTANEIAWQEHCKSHNLKG